MAKVFISYRRGDSADVTGRIYDRLEARFGHESVFMDVDTIPQGVDFREHIERAVGQADVVLVVIGPGWLAAADRDGGRRLDQPEDFVRIEIEWALGRHEAVIPVLVGGADMPQSGELPSEINALAYRNAAVVRSGRDFSVDVQRLIRSIEQSTGAGPEPPKPPESREAVPGQCPECGHVNATERQFCGACGEPLREPCFRCEFVNGAWDRYCGDCRADLAAERQDRIEQLQARQKEIEALRETHRHARAVGLLEETASVEHPRLRPFREWACDLLPTIRAELEDLERRRDELLQKAEACVSAHQYDTAVETLLQIPEPLRGEGIQRLLDDARSKAQEIAGLLADLQEAAAEGEFRGVGQKCDRLLSVVGDASAARGMVADTLDRVLECARQAVGRHDYPLATELLREVPAPLRDEAIRAELEDLERRSDELLQKAEACISAHQYDTAVQTLLQIPEPLRGEGTERLLEDTRSKAQEIAGLIADLQTAAPDGEFRGVGEKLDRLLSVVGDASAVRSMVADTLDRVLECARQAVGRHDYPLATELLREVPASLRDDPTSQLLADAEATTAELRDLQRAVREPESLRTAGELLLRLERMLKRKPDYDAPRQLAADLTQRICNAAQESLSNHGYGEAVGLLQQVPESLASDTSKRLLIEAQSKADETSSLAESIKAARRAGDDGQALVLLERFLNLVPNHAQGRQLRDKAIQRVVDVARRARYVEHDYDRAVTLLEQVPTLFLEDAAQELLEDSRAARTWWAEFCSLTERIGAAEAEAEVGRLLAELQSAWDLRPVDLHAEDVIHVLDGRVPKDVLIAFEQRILSQAELAWTRRDYEKAIALLEKVPQHRRTEAMKSLIFDCRSKLCEIEQLALSLANASGDDEGRLAEVSRLLRLQPESPLARRVIKEIVRPPTKEDLRQVASMAFVPDGLYLLLANADRVVPWDLEAGCPRGELSTHLGLVQSIACSSDGCLMVSADSQGVHVWDLLAVTNRSRGASTIEAHPVASFHEHRRTVTSVDFVASDAVVSAGEDRTIRVWDPRRGRQACCLEGHEQAVMSVSAHAVSRQVVSGGRDNTVRLWDIETGREVWRSDRLPTAVKCVAFSPTGEYAVSGSLSGAVRLWHLQEKVDQRDLLGHEGPVECVVFSPDGRRVVSTSYDQTARLWDVATGTQVACHGHDGAVSAAAFSPDGNYLLTAARSVHLWWLPE